MKEETGGADQYLSWVPLAEFGGLGQFTTGRVHLSQSGERIFAQELAGIMESFKPGLEGERHTTRFARDKPEGYHSSV